MLRNNQWEIADKPGNYSMRINFHYTNGTISGGTATYELLNKNTIDRKSTRRSSDLCFETTNGKLPISQETIL